MTMASLNNSLSWDKKNLLVFPSTLSEARPFEFLLHDVRGLKIQQWCMAYDDSQVPPESELTKQKMIWPYKLLCASCFVKTCLVIRYDDQDVAQRDIR